MDLGIHVVTFTDQEAREIGPTLARIGRAAEAAGVSTLTVMDHYFQMDQVAPAEDPMLEGYTTLGFLAATPRPSGSACSSPGSATGSPACWPRSSPPSTSCPAAGPSSASAPPGTSGSTRAWACRSCRWPSGSSVWRRPSRSACRCGTRRRQRPLRGPPLPAGRDAVLPAPLSQPRPPILIGGGGEKKTLRLVARYADACNLFAASPDDVAHKLDVLARHCDDVGRDPATVRKTILYVLPTLAQGDVDGFLADMARYARLGVTEAMVMPPPAGPTPGSRGEVWPLPPCLPKSERRGLPRRWYCYHHNVSTPPCRRGRWTEP